VLVPHGYFPFDVPCDRELTGYHVIEFGRPYAEVVTLLHRTAMRLGIQVIGFGGLSVEQVADACGLSLSKARLAKLREYDEPFRLVNAAPDARDRLWRALHATRLGCTHHASYEHVGAWVDKGTSVTLLTTWYRRAFGTIVTVGLGSAANSAALLHRVTLPFVAEAVAVGFSAQSMPGIPRLHVAANRGAWLEAILDLARRARERRRPMRLMSAAR
jgi:mannosyl-3-phosphoglycerate phosphatase